MFQAALAFALVLVVSDNPDVAERPAPDQVLRIIGGLMSEVRDLSLVYEGHLRFVGPRSAIPKQFEDVRRLGSMFQGSYSYRDDGCVALEVFRKGIATSKVTISTIVIRADHQMQKRRHDPDTGGQVITTQLKPGAPGSLDKPESPQRILYYWFFQEKLRDGGAPFSVEGWEEVDGHRCLVLGHDPFPEAPYSKRWRARYWIDLERGGHPLKLERYKGDHLLFRVHDIELARTNPSDGAVVWLPVSGVADTFLWMDKYYDQPVNQETYQVVKGSVRINQGLSDSIFLMKNADTTLRSPLLDPIRKENEAQMERARSNHTRVDAQGVKAELDRRLAQAEQQAALLEASSTARATWSNTLVLQVVFSILGGLLIVVAGFFYFRRA